MLTVEFFTFRDLDSNCSPPLADPCFGMSQIIKFISHFMKNSTRYTKGLRIISVSASVNVGTNYMEHRTPTL